MSAERISFFGTCGYHPCEERHTACLFLPNDGIVLDAGTGFFRVRDALQTRHLDILLSHAHLDHCCGATFLTDVMHEKNVERVTLHARPVDLEAVTHRLFDGALFPMSFAHQVQPLESEFLLHGWTVRTRAQVHPGGSIGFRFAKSGKSFAYITDTTADASDQAAIDFVAGVDLLIHECNFPDQHEALARRTGHSIASQVGRVAAAAAVGKLLLTHINPLSTRAEVADLCDAVRFHFPAVEVAEDRLAVDL